jgi:hypothetical protein
MSNKPHKCIIHLVGFAVLCIFLMVDVGNAAFDKIENADAIMRQSTQIKIKRDGTALFHIKEEVTIRARSGIEKAGVFAHEYNPLSERFRIIKLETRNGDTAIAVADSFIEDKSIASNLSGFDDVHQVTAAYPDVKVGSILTAEYQQEIYHPAVKGVFGFIDQLGGTIPLVEYEINVQSELPIFFKVYDRWGIFNVEEAKKGSMDELRATIRKPIYFKIVNESHSYQTSAELPIITISSLQDWRELGNRLSYLWEPRLQAPLPERLKEIASQLKDKKSEVQILDALIILLSDRFRYFGDWRPVEGSDVPRPLGDIVANGLGDCKDLTAVSVAILRHIGLDAYPAFIARGETPPPFPYDIPVDDAFDHAIVYVRGKDGQDNWLDPTNEYRPSSIIPADIADRPALIIAGSKSQLLKTPAVVPESQGVEQITVMSAMEKGWVKREMVNKYRGSPAFDINSRIVFSKLNYAAEIEAEIKKAGGSIRDFRMLSKQPRNMATPFEFVSSYSWWSEDIFYHSGAGYFYVLPTPSFVSHLLGIDIPTRESSFEVKDVGTDVFEYHLDSWKTIGSPPSNCNINTPWFSVTRSISSDNGKFALRDTVVTKKSLIPLSGIRTAEFAQAIESLKKCFLKVGVLLQTNSVANLDIH